MTGIGMCRIGAELLHSLAEHVLMNVQVPRSLRHRDGAVFHQPDRLDLKLAAEHPISVSIKPAAAHFAPTTANDGSVVGRSSRWVAACTVCRTRSSACNDLAAVGDPISGFSM